METSLQETSSYRTSSGDTSALEPVQDLSFEMESRRVIKASSFIN
jgi:hypothetical protein